MRALNSEEIEAFNEDGYVILKDWIPLEKVEALREVIDIEIEKIHASMDRRQCDVMGLSHRNSRYFIPGTHRSHRAAHEHAFGEEMASISRGLLGQDAQLFLDQLLIKAGSRNGDPGLKFGWHQDAGYIPHSKPLYLTCWTALDEMSEENGTVRVLPKPIMEKEGPVDHVKEEGSNDMIGYWGDHPGLPAVVPAGSVVAFSSYTLHCSGPNLTPNPRRALLTQYSSSPIMNADGSKLWGEAIPFLKDGEVVAPAFKEPEATLTCA